jgi:hypothetical protein
VLVACALAFSNRSTAQIPEELSPEQKAQLPGVYQKMLQRGEVPKVGACIIFIPLPCPDEETFQKSLTFILTACQVARKEDAHIVISRYGWGTNPPNPKDERLQQLEAKTEEYVSSGTVRMIGRFPEEVLVGTPWGYLFRDGKPIDDNLVTDWAKHPLPILKELKEATGHGRQGAEKNSSSPERVPSELAGREAFQKRIAFKSNNPAKLISFKKTNGVERELGGISGYELEYAAEIEFLADCWWSDKDDSFLFFPLPVTEEDKQFLGTFEGAAWQTMKKGQHRTIRGTIGFIRAERDWKLYEEDQQDPASD